MGNTRSTAHQTLTADIFVKTMKNQIKKVKKLAKKKAQHKDYAKKRNILANRPTIKKTFKKPVFKQEKDRKGVVRVVQIGEKEVTYKIQMDAKTMGVVFPKSKKFKESKKKNAKKN